MKFTATNELLRLGVNGRARIERIRGGYLTCLDVRHEDSYQFHLTMDEAFSAFTVGARVKPEVAS